MATQSGTIVHYSLQAEGSAMAQVTKVGGSRHVIRADVPPVFGGQDAHAGPLPLALAALTACSQVTAQIVARELGVAIDRITFALESDIDLAVLMGQTPSGRPDFQSVAMQVSVMTAADHDSVMRLKEATERRCPIFQLFTRAGVPIRSEWVVVR